MYKFYYYFFRSGFKFLTERSDTLCMSFLLRPSEKCTLLNLNFCLVIHGPTGQLSSGVQCYARYARVVRFSILVYDIEIHLGI